MFNQSKFKMQPMLLSLAMVFIIGAIGLWYSSARADGLPGAAIFDPTPVPTDTAPEQSTAEDPAPADLQEGVVITGTLTAPEACYTLTRQVTPTGSGNIRANPAPNCANNRYLSGTEVRLTAEPAVGATFLYWSGNASGSNNPIRITMNTNKTVTAHFTQPCYTLNRLIQPAGAGATSASPQPNCASGTLYLPGTVVQVWATPALGYNFSNWSGDMTGTTNPMQITLNSNKTVTANSAFLCYTLTTAINPSGGGSILLTPPPNCENNTKYIYGSVVTLTASPNAGFLFKSWSGDATGFANPTSITMSANRSVMANFENPTPIITHISPDMILAGGGNFTLSVEGTNFNALSKVRWNGSDLTTQYIHAQLLEASVPAANIASPGVASITVYTPAPGGGISAPAGLTIGSNNPIPVLTGFSPPSLPPSGQNSSLKLLGRNFASGAQGLWNGNPLATTFIKSTEILVTVPGSYLAALGTAQVTVSNPAPGGGSSAAVTFYINRHLYLPIVCR